MKGRPDYDGEHHVYRVFDGLDRLLYIGCTSDVNARMAVHRAWGNQSEASFGIKLYGTRFESQAYPSFAEARSAERAAIEAEAPYLNREHNPTRWARVKSGYLPVGESYEPPPRPLNTELRDALDAMFRVRESS